MNRDLIYKAVIAALCSMAIGLSSPLSATPVISATKNDAISNDVNSDGMANPGDGLKYTVTITNSGDMSGTNVQFTDLLDPNTTLVAGSVTVTPIAAADNYSISGNTTLGGMFIDASNGLLANDVDPNGGGLGGSCGGICTVTVQMATPTTQGGMVNVNADGSFEYFPEAGNTTTDTFSYEITDAEGKTDTGTVSIMFPEVIWYVDNSQATNGNGTSDSPFNNLASAASASSAGDMIFVLSGSAPSVTGQNSGIILQDGQSLVGQGVDLVVTFNGTPQTLFTAGTPPVITHTGGTAVTLASNNTIKGLNIGDGSNPVIGTGIADNGSPLGTLTVSSVTVTTSTGPALDLDVAGTLATTFGSLSSSNSTSRGLRLANLGGTFTVSGTTTISSPATEGVLLSNNNTGTFNFGGLNITNTGNTGFSASSSGTVNVTGMANTIATSTGTALNLTNTTIGVSGLHFRSISASAGTNGIVLNNTGSTAGLTVTGSPGLGLCGGQVSNTTNPAVAATVTAPNTADCTGGTIQNATGDGIRLISTAKVSLTRMQVINSAQSGIFGTNVNGFELLSSHISNNGNNVDEVGLKFTDVTDPGTVNGLVGSALVGSNPTRIVNSTVRQSGEFNVEIVNRTGVLTDLLVDGSQFTDTKLNAGPADADGFQVEMQGTSTGTIRLTNSFFSNNFTQGANLSAIDTAILTATVTSSTFTNNNEGFVCNHSGGSDLFCTVGGDLASQGNHFEGEPTAVDSGALIVASTGSSATSSASQTTKFKNNHVTAPANMVNHSIIAFMSGTATPGSVNVSNNTVNHVTFGHAILVDTPDDERSPNFGVTANNNAVTNNAPGGHGVLAQARQNSTACVLIQNNTGTVAAGSSVARVRASSVAGPPAQNATLNLKQGVSSSTVATTVIADNNPGVATSAIGTTLNVVANGACTTPTQ